VYDLGQSVMTHPASEDVPGGFGLLIGESVGAQQRRMRTMGPKGLWAYRAHSPLLGAS